MIDKQKIILLSGASRGIGKAIAKTLYESGYYISLGVRDITSLEAATHGWEKDRFLIVQYDALENGTANDWVTQTIKKFKKIDGIVNCAGILKFCDIENFEEKNLDMLWEINVKAPVYLTKLVWPYLKNSGEGRIVNIVSLLGKRIQGPDFGYGMSKHALLAFTHALRKSGWTYGIRATALCPGWVNTDMAKDNCSIDLSEIIQPEDVGKIVSLVLSLPNTASISEIPINSECDDLY
jgi:NADP-dependent 3-hydroxy acid dehydrogenase YdfG